ncbi:MAG: serine/threonine protein kinase, partial [Lentisphaeraceae bacterium]|nr:serine/threonine protein kinase [Lentisphaeraceae bacterium]
MGLFEDNLQALYHKAWSQEDLDSSSSGRYGERKFIAAGSVKEVYSVNDHITGRRVALALLKNGATDKEREFFIREARINAILQHPHI